MKKRKQGEATETLNWEVAGKGEWARNHLNT